MGWISNACSIRLKTGHVYTGVKCPLQESEALAIFRAGNRTDLEPCPVRYLVWFLEGFPGTLVDWPRSGQPVVVPPGEVFVMGDNRDNSADSRVWGFVRYDQIKGKVGAVAFSWDECAGRVRPERFLRSLAGTPEP